jgi:mono/diheme cytochrome c family protein
MKVYGSFTIIFVVLQIVMILPPRSNASDVRFDVSELTVKDRQTGLVWSRNGDMARDIPGFSIHVMRNIDTLIMNLNKEEYGDCGNWHVPSREELETLLEYAQAQGYGRNSGKDGKTISKLLREIGFTDINNASYLSSTTYSNHARSYWHLFMADGRFADDTTETCGVLPVCFNNGQNEDIITKGRVIFKEQCSACHELKDTATSNPDTSTMGKMETKKCKFGKNYSTVINGIRNGTSKGMPQFKNILSTDKIYAVTIYVLTLRCGQGQVF